MLAGSWPMRRATVVRKSRLWRGTTLDMGYGAIQPRHVNRSSTIPFGTRRGHSASTHLKSS